MYRYLVVGLVSCMAVGIVGIVGVLSCFVSSGDVVEYELSGC